MNELLKGRGSLRELAEDDTAELASAVAAWWEMAGRFRGCAIADVLLMRACAELGIKVDGVNATEHIERWKT